MDGRVGELGCAEGVGYAADHGLGVGGGLGDGWALCGDGDVDGGHVGGH